MIAHDDLQIQSQFCHRSSRCYRRQAPCPSALHTGYVVDSRWHSSTCQHFSTSYNYITFPYTCAPYILSRMSRRFRITLPMKRPRRIILYERGLSGRLGSSPRLGPSRGGTFQPPGLTPVQVVGRRGEQNGATSHLEDIAHPRNWGLLQHD